MILAPSITNSCEGKTQKLLWIENEKDKDCYLTGNSTIQTRMEWGIKNASQIMQLFFNYTRKWLLTIAMHINPNYTINDAHE